MTMGRMQNAPLMRSLLPQDTMNGRASCVQVGRLLKAPPRICIGLFAAAGDPPALPRRQQKFDRSGSALPFCNETTSEGYPVLRRPERASILFCYVWELGIFDFNRLRSGPFEGPATVIPALPEDTCSKPSFDGRRTLLTPSSRPMSFVSGVMCNGVACRAQRDQVLL